jgi:hypothetical protein
MKLIEPGFSRFVLQPHFTKASTELVSQIKEARASSEYLRTLIPEIDAERNPDILAVSFDSAVANLVNLNDDAILTKEAKILAPSFANKPINVEHNKSWVVGSILNVGFSSFGDGSAYTPEKDDDHTPFNICLGGVLWRHVDPYFVDMVEESTKKHSWSYNSISASWEVGFEEFVLALGSKNLRDAELVTEDAQVKELMGFLKSEGGTGFTKDGVPVYRVIGGTPVAFGIGLTGTPAGNVKGISVAAEIAKTEEDRPIELSTASLEKISNIIDEKVKNISHSTNLNVKTNTKIMKIKELADINDDFVKEAQASSEIREFIKLELKKQADKLEAEAKAEKDKAEAAVKLVEEEKAKAATEKANADKLAQEVLTVKNELQSIKDSQEAKAKEEMFAKHLTEVEAEFKLDAAAKEIVKAQIQNLDATQFAEWKKNFATLFASLKKDEKDNTDAATKVVASAEKVKANLPNSGEGGQGTSVLDRFRKAFTTVTETK